MLGPKDYLTDPPRQAVEFIQATGINLFAPAIGTQHGLYSGRPNIDFDRLQEIRAAVSIPPSPCTEVLIWAMELFTGSSPAGVEKNQCGNRFENRHYFRLKGFSAG